MEKIELGSKVPQKKKKIKIKKIKIDGENWIIVWPFIFHQKFNATFHCLPNPWKIYWKWNVSTAYNSFFPNLLFNAYGVNNVCFIIFFLKNNIYGTMAMLDKMPIGNFTGAPFTSKT